MRATNQLCYYNAEPKSGRGSLTVAPRSADVPEFQRAGGSSLAYFYFIEGEAKANTLPCALAGGKSFRTFAKRV